jgi:LPXTG-motif cell wall-anchored protein
MAATTGEPQLWSSILTGIALVLIGWLGWRQRRKK